MTFRLPQDECHPIRSVLCMTARALHGDRCVLCPPGPFEPLLEVRLSSFVQPYEWGARSAAFFAEVEGREEPRAISQTLSADLANRSLRTQPAIGKRGERTTRKKGV
jgi:hypothetical protein